MPRKLEIPRGYGTRRPPRKHELTVGDFAREYLNDPKMFVGFSDYQDVVERWIETDLMDMVRRAISASSDLRSGRAGPTLMRDTGRGGWTTSDTVRIGRSFAASRSTSFE